MFATLTKTVSRPWRRFLRFSVRGLIVSVLVIGGWLGWVVREARIQRDAVAAIKKAGGDVWYDWQWHNGRKTPGKPWAPEWLIRAIGVDYFGRVAGVSCLHRVSVPGYDRTFTAHFKSLGDLTDLDLSFTAVTDDGLANLAGLTNLVTLNLEGTQITDAGLIHLERLTKIETLYLPDNRITDAGLSHLTGLAKLSRLCLQRDPQVTDSELETADRSDRMIHIAIGHANSEKSLAVPPRDRSRACRQHPAEIPGSAL
jgi:internalin A